MPSIIHCLVNEPSIIYYWVNEIRSRHRRKQRIKSAIKRVDPDIIVKNPIDQNIIVSESISQGAVLGSDKAASRKALPPEIILSILLYDSDLNAYHSLLGVIPRYVNIEIKLCVKFVIRQRFGFYGLETPAERAVDMRKMLVTDIENEIAIRYHDAGYTGLTREMFIGAEVYPVYLLITKKNYDILIPREPDMNYFYPGYSARLIGVNFPGSVFILLSKAKGRSNTDRKISIYSLAKGSPRLETRCVMGKNAPNSVSLSSNGRYICLKYKGKILIYDRWSENNRKHFSTLGRKIFEYPNRRGIGMIEISNDGQVLILDIYDPRQLKLINLRTREEIDIPLPVYTYISLYGNMIISVCGENLAPPGGFIIDMTSSQYGSTLWDRCKALSQKKIIFPIQQPRPLSIRGLYLGHTNGKLALTKLQTTIPLSLTNSNTVNVSDMSSTVILTNLRMEGYTPPARFIWTLSPDTTRMALAYTLSDPSRIALANLEPAVLKTFRFEPNKTTSSTLQFRYIDNVQLRYVRWVQFIENNRLLVVSQDRIAIYELGPTIKNCYNYILE